MAKLTISLIGAFQVNLDDHLVTRFESNKVRALLAYLAVESSRSHSRQALAGLLWPDYPEPSALANLRHALANLREVLANDLANPAYLTITREQVQFNPASPAQVDLAAFEGQIRAASTPESTASPQQSSSPALYAAENIHQLKSAIALYRAPFLEGFSCDSQPFEEWALVRRERTERQMREALAGLARLLGENGEAESSIQYARRLLELEPWDEAAHRLVMEGLARTGQRSAALAQFETCRRVLRQELNLEPAAETMLLHETICSGKFGAAVRAIPVLEEMAPSPRPNLPRPLTSFVGREENLAEVRRLLGYPGVEGPTQRPTTRLLTLSGPGGCGKTRLAIAAARSLDEAGCFRDGVCWVDLTALSDPGLVPQAVADGLGLSKEAGDRGVWNYLFKKELLLVLDNTEHLIEACARLAEDLLNECPGLVILATSREPLQIHGEIVWRVPSLAAPKPQAAVGLSAAVLLEYGAVRLFVERAEAASPGWKLMDCLDAVAVICQRLDGIPLAIELAAARVRMMSAGQIAARLEDAFSLLSGGSRTAMPRHQTLHSCIDWSYNLLSEVEQILLQHLSIFAGGWTLEAAEGVAAGVAGTTTVLDLLGHLVDRSLVIIEQTEDQAVRYRLLETIRQYAQAKLADTGGEAAVRDRHLAYFLALAERIEPELRSLGKRARLNQMTKELGNLRLALGYGLKTNPEVELRLASALMWFRMPYMPWEEGAAWLEQGLALAEPRAVHPGVRAKALSACGRAYVLSGKLNLAKERWEESLRLYRVQGEAGKKGVPLALYWLGLVVSYSGDPSLGGLYLREALALYQIISDPINTSGCLHFLSQHLWHNEVGSQEAYRLAEECLALQIALDDPDGVAYTNRLLGMAALEELDLARAKSFFEKSIFINQQVGEIDGIIEPILGLGDIALLVGDYALAQSHFQKAEAIQRTSGSQTIIFPCICLGDLYLVSGKNELARQYIGEVQTCAEKTYNSFYLGLAQHQLARWAWLEGEQAQAREMYAAAMANLIAGQDLSRNYSSQIRWGSLLCHGGDPAEAAVNLQEGIRYFGKTRNWAGMALGLDSLARLAAGSQPERAARLFGAAAQMHPHLLNTLYPLERAGRETAINQAKAALGAEVFARIWEEGQAMRNEAAVTYALADGESLAG